MSTSHQRVRTGFSLIEVIVVTSIVLIVLSIVMAAYGRVIAVGHHTVCVSNLKQLGTAICLYASDNDDFLPPFTNSEYYLAQWEPGATGDYPTDSQQPALLVGSLVSYSGRSIWFCPADNLAGQVTYALGIRHRFTSYWYRPYDLATLESGKRWPLVISMSSAVLLGERILQDAAGAGIDGKDPLNKKRVSNHADGRVNFVRLDTSAGRVFARTGTDD